MADAAMLDRDFDLLGTQRAGIVLVANEGLLRLGGRPAADFCHADLRFKSSFDRSVYVGSGKSDWTAYTPERYRTLHGYAQDVLDVCEALDLRDIVFVGHSVSSVVGLLASIQAPERFARHILIGWSPCYINDGEYVGGFERKDIEGLLDMMEKNYIGWATFLATVVMKKRGAAGSHA